MISFDNTPIGLYVCGLYTEEPTALESVENSMLYKSIASMTLGILLTSAACSKQVADAPAVAVAQEQAAVAKNVDADDEKNAEECDKHEGVQKDGEPYKGNVGAELSGQVEVTVADLIADPDTYKGQKVTVNGPVKAMCHHKRSWFAIGDDGKAIVRVITGPDFLVPAGIMNTNATAEGSVEVIAVSPQRADHFAKDHNIGEPVQSADIVKQVILRASGARFE
jgi:hypothetical protein